VDSDFNCLLEDPDGGWHWSPDSLSHQESRVITDDDYRFLVIEYDSDVAA